MTQLLPRGIRNNNPGNIRYDGTPWRGLAAPQSDGAFCRFSDAKYGIRAMAKVILNYEKMHGLNTVAGIISRWAPPIENNTAAYVAAVARDLGCAASAPIDVGGNLPTLCRAIVKHENGQCPYSDAEIEQGIALC